MELTTFRFSPLLTTNYPLMKDFTLHTYSKLLQALKVAGYNFCTFEDWCEGKAINGYVILRHDIDNKPQHALRFAKVEAELRIRATYYFRTSKNILCPTVINEIAALGHEIGYHYRDLVDNNGNVENAIYSFQKNLSALRSMVSVRTISMDGCPWSKYDNRDLWKTYDYRDFGIIGEPYFDILDSKLNGNNKIQYFTDTARMWNGDRYNVRDKSIINESLPHSTVLPTSSKRVDDEVIHSTFDFINHIKTNPTKENMMITTHPQRWTDNTMEWMIELVTQGLKNKVKQLLIRFR
ncbi:MAG: hypothetical protein GZ091_16385 [Paludibacter sp.]|nr:hypothetical protein [Paludibacter sp.]